MVRASPDGKEREGRERRFGGYAALIVPGVSCRLVISLAGVGDPDNNRMSYEWKRTLEVELPGDHLIFIKDIPGTYFNSEDGYSELLEFILSYISYNKIDDLVLLGLSMGGYGA